MSIISSPSPTDITNHYKTKRRVSNWIASTKAHAHGHAPVDAFAPLPRAASRASSLESSAVLPSHSPSVRDSGYERSSGTRTGSMEYPYSSPMTMVPMMMNVPGAMPMHTPMQTFTPITPTYNYQTAQLQQQQQIAYPVPYSTPYTTPVNMPHSSSRSRGRSLSRSAPVPPPITPVDYIPLSSNGRESSTHRARSRAESTHHSIRDLPRSMGYGDRQPHTASGSYGHSHYHPSQPSYDYRDEDSDRHRHRHHRSSSHHPPSPVTSSFSRPAYTRRRSRSYDPPPVSAPHYSSSRREYMYGNGSRDPYRDFQTVQASPTSPTVIRPSDAQPVMVPLNDGRDGWVLVPAPGQKLKVVNSAKEARALSRDHERGRESFFSRHFGSWGNKNRKRSRSHAQPQPQVISMVNPSRSRRSRRDSY